MGRQFDLVKPLSILVFPFEYKLFQRFSDLIGMVRFHSFDILHNSREVQ